MRSVQAQSDTGATDGAVDQGDRRLDEAVEGPRDGIGFAEDLAPSRDARLPARGPVSAGERARQRRAHEHAIGERCLPPVGEGGPQRAIGVEIGNVAGGRIRQGQRAGRMRVAERDSGGRRRRSAILGQRVDVNHLFSVHSLSSWVSGRGRVTRDAPRIRMYMAP